MATLVEQVERQIERTQGDVARMQAENQAAASAGDLPPHGDWLIWITQEQIREMVESLEYDIGYVMRKGV